MPCRSRWNIRHRPLALSCVATSIIPQLYSYPAVHVSFSRSLLQVFLGRPLPLWPCGVHLWQPHVAATCISRSSLFLIPPVACHASLSWNWTLVHTKPAEASRVRPRDSCHMLHRCVHAPVEVLAPDWVLNVNCTENVESPGDIERYCRESTKVVVTAIMLVNDIYTAESRQHTYRVVQPIRQTSGWRGDVQCWMK